jgi:hypothetical protein
MNEEIIEEIYNKLVECFGIGDVFLPKHGKRKATITWKEFINATFNLKTDELYTYCGYSSKVSFSLACNNRHKELMGAKNRRRWSTYLLDLVNKKWCPICTLILSNNEFYPDETRIDSKKSTCKKCLSSAARKYNESNKESVTNQKRQYRVLNKENISIYNKEYRLLNKDSLSERDRIYYINNKYLFNARSSKRRATKLQATPNWANLIAIKEIYRTCPTGCHVDHIVPLQGKLVCGLHCEFNLQHLPASENLSKSNKFEI